MLAVLGCSTALALACGGGLEHEFEQTNYFAAGCADDGGVAQKVLGFGDHPIGLGQPF